MSIIRVEGLNFEYADKQVLHDISFTIEQGSITALVGPNGAGKSTLLRCLCGLATPLSGEITIDGINVIENPRAAHSIIGYLSDFFGLHNDLTVRQSLIHMAMCHNMPENAIDAAVARVAARTGLMPLMESTSGSLSRGWRQRLGIALAIIHDPKIVILDEPASGVDPEARIHLSRLMIDLQAEGKTLIVSSHILSELEDYSTSMLVIRDGRATDNIKLDSYRSQNLVTIRIMLNGQAQPHAEKIKALANATHCTARDSELLLTFSAAREEQQKLLAALVHDGVPVSGFNIVEATLADAYMSLTERK